MVRVDDFSPVLDFGKFSTSIHSTGFNSFLSAIFKTSSTDLTEIPKKILNEVEVVPVKTVDEVLKIALTKELKSIEWIEVENLPKTKSGEKSASIPN